MPWPVVFAVLVGVAAGAGAGWAGRRVLARLRRGVTLPPPVMEMAGAAVTGLGVLLAWPSPTVLLVVWAGLLAVVLGAVDIAVHRLPDALTLPAVPITALLVLGTWTAAPTSGAPPTALIAAAVATAVFAGLAMLAPRAMGRGDVKLVPSLALLTGYVSIPAVLWWLILAFGLGGLVALAGLATRRLSLGSAIPFGPCLLAGCWLVLALPGWFTG
jgi:leader peptidase (prepilin peptidase)/N-methyltransferase